MFGLRLQLASGGSPPGSATRSLAAIGADGLREILGLHSLGRHCPVLIGQMPTGCHAVRPGCLHNLSAVSLQGIKCNTGDKSHHFCVGREGPSGKLGKTANQRLHQALGPLLANSGSRLTGLTVSGSFTARASSAH